MKNVIAALIALTASTSAFAGEQYYCHGNFETDPSATLFVKMLSHDKIVEGEKMEMLVVIRDGARTLFEGRVDARNEDVQVFLKSRRGQPKLHGMIFLDELDQTSINVAGEQMNFDCNPNE